MYKFTNGIVVYDEETKNKYIKAGMTLVEEPKPIKPVIKEEKNAEERLQSKVECDGFRRNNKQPSKFNKRNK